MTGRDCRGDRSKAALRAAPIRTAIEIRYSQIKMAIGAASGPKIEVVACVRIQRRAAAAEDPECEGEDRAQAGCSATTSAPAQKGGTGWSGRRSSPRSRSASRAR